MKYIKSVSNILLEINDVIVKLQMFESLFSIIKESLKAKLLNILM